MCIRDRFNLAGLTLAQDIEFRRRTPTAGNMLACSRCYEETDRETDIARRDPSQLVRSGARERCIVAEPGEASMGSQLYSLGLTGSLLCAISACEAAPEESSVARADKHEICLADPPVDVPTRQVFELNDCLLYT